MNDTPHLETAILPTVLTNIENRVIRDHVTEAQKIIARESEVDIPALDVDEPDPPVVVEIDQKLHDLGARHRRARRSGTETPPRRLIRDRMHQLDAQHHIERQHRPNPDINILIDHLTT